MARRSPKTPSIYDKLSKNELDIVSTENRLKSLKSEREQLLQEKDDYEMRTVWATIKEQGFTLEEIQKLISKKNSAQNK